MRPFQGQNLVQHSISPTRSERELVEVAFESHACTHPTHTTTVSFHLVFAEIWRGGPPIVQGTFVRGSDAHGHRRVRAAA